MSHFTVMVVGDDAENQLMPFSENMDDIVQLETRLKKEYYTQKWREHFASDNRSTTMQAERYVLKYLFDADVTQDRREEWELDVKEGKNHEDTFPEYVYNYYAGHITFVPKAVYENNKDKEPEDELFIFGARYAVLNAVGQIERIVSHGVKAAKWDWFVLGGRWKNFFRLKSRAVLARYRYERPMDVIGSLFPDQKDPREQREGSDMALKSEIDFDRMYEEGKEQALKLYDDFHAILKGRPYPRWSDCVKKHKEDYNAAREDYHQQEVVKDLRGTDFDWMGEEEINLFTTMDRDAYGDFGGKREGLTLAFLKDGEWTERGEMGWFGMMREEKFTPQAWVEHFRKAIAELPDDTLLSVYDCHI